MDFLPSYGTLLVQVWGFGSLLSIPWKVLNAKVESIISHGIWRWPRSRNPVTRDIISLTPANFKPNPALEDRVVCSLHPSGEYTVIIIGMSVLKTSGQYVVKKCGIARPIYNFAFELD